LQLVIRNPAINAMIIIKDFFIRAVNY
ncbi:MAG: hypothetical protein H6Q23_1951, partial [Bacteroidetes bacterium]|nr:hypothetical protein [Bacteroidota bacterium]